MMLVISRRLRDQQVSAMPRLFRSVIDLATSRDALTGWQFGMVLDSGDQEIKGLLGVLFPRTVPRRCKVVQIVLAGTLQLPTAGRQ